MSADSQPTGFSGSSSSELPKSLPGTNSKQNTHPGHVAAVEIVRSHETMGKHMKTLTEHSKSYGDDRNIDKNKRENFVTTVVNSISNICKTNVHLMAQCV